MGGEVSYLGPHRRRDLAPDVPNFDAAQVVDADAVLVVRVRGLTRKADELAIVDDAWMWYDGAVVNIRD